MSYRPWDWAPLADSDPVPGDPDELDRLVGQLRATATAIQQAAADLRTFGDSDLVGEIGRIFRMDSAVRGAETVGPLIVRGLSQTAIGGSAWGGVTYMDGQALPPLLGLADDAGPPDVTGAPVEEGSTR